MGLYDRDYYKGDARGRGSGGGGFGGGGLGGGDGFRRVLELLNASFPIGTYLGIAVRVHVTFPIVVVLFLLPSIGRGNFMFAFQGMVLLFLSVLLHEFGHCLGCRAVGGRADNILMWPLGGLAFCDPPRRPWPEFVTVACGPLVNVVLAAVAWICLALIGLRAGLNPFNWSVEGSTAAPRALVDFLWGLFLANYMLLLFNLALVFYPFDGGRLVQIAVWTRIGYTRSLRLAARMGMVGAGAIALVGLYTVKFLLVFIAAFGFYTCYRQAQVLRYASEDQYGLGLDADYSAACAGEAPRPGRVSRWKAAREERRRQREARERREREQKVDAILDKIHCEGIASLTAAEKRILQESSRDSNR